MALLQNAVLAMCAVGAQRAACFTSVPIAQAWGRPPDWSRGLPASAEDGLCRVLGSVGSRDFSPWQRCMFGGLGWDNQRDNVAQCCEVCRSLCACAECACALPPTSRRKKRGLFVSQELRAVNPHSLCFDDYVNHTLWMQKFPRLGNFYHYHQLVPCADTTEAGDDGDMYLCTYSVPKRRALKLFGLNHVPSLESLYRLFHQPSTRVNVAHVRRSGNVPNYHHVVHPELRELDGFGYPDFTVIFANGKYCVQDAPCIYELNPEYSKDRRAGFVCTSEAVQRGHCVYERVG